MTNNELSDRLKNVEGIGVSSTRFGNIPMFWKSGKGCKVYDYNNEVYLDCTSSYGVMGIGYSHPAVIEAVSDTINSISHTMCEIYPNEKYLYALENIRKAVGRTEEQVILAGSGSDAIDVAIKLAFRYTKKTGIISFKESFHGQTLNSLNYTGQSCFRDPFSKILPNNVTFISYPNIYRNEFQTEELLLVNTVKNIERVIENKMNSEFEIGAILVEPMQNASGYIIPPKGFLSQIRTICKKYDILMISDEIFTGFGRCGRWLMEEYESVQADILCVGKVMTGGAPAAACIARKDIMQALDYDGMVPLHGSTFTGNAMICSSIVATIDIIKKERLVERSAQIGAYIRRELKKIFANTEIVGDVRGYGSATMIEFVKNRTSKERFPEAAKNFSQFLLNHKIISLVSGLPFGNCVALCLPFIMSDNELEYIVTTCHDFAVMNG